MRSLLQSGIAEQLWHQRVARWLITAAVLGLLMGAFLALFVSSKSNTSSNINLEAPWQVRDVPLEELKRVLSSSEIWGNERVSDVAETEAEAVVEDAPRLPDRPGVFKHLELVAVLRKPALAAVLQPVKMPESLKDEMISLPNDAGLYEVAVGEEVATGWRVSGISDTYLEIVSVESNEQVKYRLFAWQP